MLPVYNPKSANVNFCYCRFQKLDPFRGSCGCFRCRKNKGKKPKFNPCDAIESLQVQQISQRIAEHLRHPLPQGDYEVS
jgi:hypothetical protein